MTCRCRRPWSKKSWVLLPADGERNCENDFPPQDLEASGHQRWLEIFMLDFHFKFYVYKCPKRLKHLFISFHLCALSARAFAWVLSIFKRRASANRKLWRYFLKQTFYSDEGVILETSDNLTLKSGNRNIHFLVLIISYEYHAAKTYFVTYLRDLVLDIFRFSWYFGRCFWFFGGCSGFSGECSWFSGDVPGFLECVPGLRWCSGFFGCSGMFRCSGVPGSTTCR